MNPLQDPPPKSNREVLYEKAKSHLGQHLTLDDSVPKEYGCAQAVSFVFHETKFTCIPKGGISGTASLLGWFKANPDLFHEVSIPRTGTIILSPTGLSPKGAHGHVGIVGEESIMSNDSQSGEWHAYWNLASWHAYYQVNLGIPTYFFDLV